MFSSSINMISIKLLIIFIIVLCSYNGGVGVKGIRSISSEEEDDLELEWQLKILNKTPIKTFQIAEGETVDCVDIYKQPAFDHALLKNHKLQLSPSRILPGSSSNKKPQSVIQKVDCPKGTVPIRRTSKEDLIRAKAFEESYPPPPADAAAAATNTSAYHQNVVVGPAQHIAVVSTQAPGMLYYGVAGTLNSQNPVVSAGQTSSSQLWIESIPSVRYNTLQAGWIVSPQLFNDTRTHIFGYWKAEGMGGGGCYNILCPGFVQYDREIFLGAHVHETSYYGGRLIVIEYEIYQDDKTGNWWLTTEHRTHIGYWPKELVPSLIGGTTTVSWGGAANLNRNGQGPEMGNGHFPAGTEKWNYGCFITNMKVYNQEYFWEYPTHSVMKTYADKEQCYKVEYYGYVDRDFQYSLQFGGPGGICT